MHTHHVYTVKCTSCTPKREYIGRGRRSLLSAYSYTAVAYMSTFLTSFWVFFLFSEACLCQLKGKGSGWRQIWKQQKVMFLFQNTFFTLYTMQGSIDDIFILSSIPLKLCFLEVFACSGCILLQKKTVSKSNLAQNRLIKPWPLLRTSLELGT